MVPTSKNLMEGKFKVHWFYIAEYHTNYGLNHSFFVSMAAKQDIYHNGCIKIHRRVKEEGR